MSVKIIRIEGTDGIGIFKSDLIEYNNTLFWEIHDSHGSFPTPMEDDLNRKKADKEWFCAYLSVCQLKNWLAFYLLNKLVNLGFTITELTVNEFQKGEFQYLFTKESILNKVDITKKVLSSYTF